MTASTGFHPAEMSLSQTLSPRQLHGSASVADRFRSSFSYLTMQFAWKFVLHHYQFSPFLKNLSALPFLLLFKLMTCFSLLPLSCFPLSISHSVSVS